MFARVRTFENYWTAQHREATIMTCLVQGPTDSALFAQVSVAACLHTQDLVTLLSSLEYRPRGDVEGFGW